MKKNTILKEGQFITKGKKIFYVLEGNKLDVMKGGYNVYIQEYQSELEMNIHSSDFVKFKGPFELKVLR